MEAAAEALGYTVEQFKQMTTNLIGEKAVERLGERMGGAMALMRSEEFGSQFHESLRPVIDTILLEDRLSDSDLQTLFKGLRQGYDESIRLGTLTFKEGDLRNILRETEQSPGAIKKTIFEFFGASKQHKYAALTAHDAIGATRYAQFKLINRLNLAAMPQDASLAVTDISEKSRKIANVILDKHAEAYENLISRQWLLDELDEFSEYERFLVDEGKQRLGYQIYHDIVGAQQLGDLTREDIINAIEKVAAERASLTRRRETAIDLTRLDYFAADEDFLEQLTTIRARRNAAAIRVTAGDLEENVLTDLVAKQLDSDSALKRSDQIEGMIDDYFKKILQKSDIDEETKYLAQALLGESMEGATEEQVQLARSRAQVIKTHFQKQVLERNTTTVEALTTKVGTTFTGDNNLRRAINAAMDDEDYVRYLGAKGKYVRFSEYMKSGALKGLFKNNNLFRNSIYVTGALIVGSFAYQGFKDHTPEAMQGPPMLPGGSAYESQYPKRSSEIPQIGTVSYNPGVSYKVNLYGNRNQVQQFQDMAMGLGNFDMDTTMYSGIPQIGMDPYQQLASSY